jgi:molybdenum cofactor cytidylyltransferase
MLSSVQKAFSTIPSEASAAIIMLGDQPSAGSSIINKIIKAYKAYAKGIVLPVCQKRRGHPVLIDLKYRDEVMALPAEIGLRELIRRHPEEILEVPIKTQSIFQDIDRPEDYREAVNSPGKRTT